MFLLQGVLRCVLLCYALYSFAIGIWLIIQAENLSPAAAAEYDHIMQSGLRKAAIAIYEFIAAWRDGQPSFLSIAVVRVFLYAVLNEVWLWGVGWPSVDENLVIIAIAVEAAML